MILTTKQFIWHKGIVENKCKRTSLVIPEKMHTELKIMCVLTQKKMGDFIRIAISDKMNELKDKNVAR